MSPINLSFLLLHFHLKNEIIDKGSISNAIKVLQSKEILVEDKAGNIMPPAENSLFFHNYIALSNLCEPSLKRFYIVMSTIWKSESILKDDLNIKCKKLAEDLEKIEGWPYPEFSDKAKFDNFVYMIKQTKIFREDSEGKLSASKITKKAKNLYEQFFDKDFLELIERQSS